VDSGIWLLAAVRSSNSPPSKSDPAPDQIQPVQFNPFYWATESLKLKPDVSPNLISLEDQMAPQRRTFAKVCGRRHRRVMILSVGAAAYSSLAARQERLNIKMLQARRRGCKSSARRYSNVMTNWLASSTSLTSCSKSAPRRSPFGSWPTGAGHSSRVGGDQLDRQTHQ